MYLEEFVEVSLKLVDPNSCGDKRPWEVERSGYCLISTWILVAFKHLERLICFDETIITILLFFCTYRKLYISQIARLNGNFSSYKLQRLNVLENLRNMSGSQLLKLSSTDPTPL